MTTTHVFVMTLGYSRRAYVEGFLSERLSSLLEADEHAFAWFGGHYAELLYDETQNLKCMVFILRPMPTCTFSPS